MVGPADQDLSGAQSADAGQVRQLGVNVVDQARDVAFELVRLGLECLDAVGGGAHRPDGGAVLEVLGGTVAQFCAVADLGVAALASQFRAEVLGSGDNQCFEMVDRRGAGGDRAGSCAHQDAQGFALAPAARLDQAVAAEDFPGGSNRIEGVVLASAAPRWALGSADFDDLFALFAEEGGESGTIAAGSFDGPASLAGHLRSREVQQLPVALGAGWGVGMSQRGADCGDRGCGEGVAVGVDADDAFE